MYVDLGAKVNQAIVIVTHPSNKLFLGDLLESFGGYNRYPLYTATNSDTKNEYEIGGIRFGFERGFDEFFLLPDSCIIKDPELFDIAFLLQGISISIGKRYMSYMGKYRREILEQLKIPEVTKKSEAVAQEILFHDNYLAIETKYQELDKTFWEQPEKFEFKHGRNNLINENNFIKKYKGTWSLDMVKDNL